ncbi:MAG: hypothetical protein IJ617_02890 [Oscillospiraceae bacterium]|nr:hypothetical protein [Oscillospiraceae bacterium]
MELLSDAIFGSGYSIPGGEDVAVCRDTEGYPYLKGSTFKGLLRESLENWLSWTGGAEAELNALLGESGWDGAEDGRKLHLTELRLLDAPADPESCYSERTFTALEDGIVKEGTLRTAACVRAGLCFGGEIECGEADVPLLRDALRNIKWAGTMRSRGFGRVRVAGTPAERQTRKPGGISSAFCIRYRLYTESPVLITDLSRSRGNGMETRSCIPGSAVRGMVAGYLAANAPDWFSENRAALLGGKTRFLDVVPIRGEQPAIPSLMGFYEDKEETKFETLLRDGSFSPGLKRAKLGAFCALDGDTVRFWSASSAGATRIGLDHGEEYSTEMFQTRYLEAGQTLEGYILLDDPALAEQISLAFPSTVWLGADRFSGFGKCAVTLLEAAEGPDWAEAYGYQAQSQIGTELYLLAVSPFTMLDAGGSPCGLDEIALARALGVGTLTVEVCSTAVTEFGGYNRTWKCRVPAAQMYERGSVFHLRCGRPPALERLLAVQREGIGIRRSEGFGQVLFLRPELLEGLKRKEAVKAEAPARSNRVSDLRRQKYQWVMEQADKLRKAKLSPSQIGTLQSLCEKAIRRDGELTELYAWLEKNLSGRGVAHGERFAATVGFVRAVLDGSAEKLPPSLDIKDRLDLLCRLCDYSRRSEGKEAKAE